ncbi:MAG: hypothetical protein SF162_16330 [bacterium]|nr:hypothetical protein [bacterium]
MAEGKAASTLRVGTALRFVLPRWIAFCALCIVTGISMQVLPGMAERAQLYIDSWSHNLVFGDAMGSLTITELGYSDSDREVSPAVRFPLYPLMVRWAAPLFGGDTSLSAFWVSKIALLAGLVGLWVLVEHLHGAQHANRTTPYMLFPFLGTAYTWIYSYPEAAYLALWTWGFVLLFKKAYYGCALVTILAVWSRPHAVLILIPYALYLLIETYRERRPLGDSALWRAGLLTCGLPLIAFAAWVLHVSQISALPFAPITAQTEYGRAEQVVLPWMQIPRRLEYMQTYGVFAFNWTVLFENYQLISIMVSLILFGLFALWRRVPLVIVAFSILTIIPGLSTGIFAIGRYALLTWVPLAALYIVPPKYDAVLLPLLIGMNYLVLFVTEFSDAAEYVP